MSYGSDYYGYSGPGGYLDAKAYLDGPGSHAYLHQGSYTSYAYEGQNGSVFQQNTTTFKGGYEQSTSYSYSTGSYTSDRISEFTYHNPPLYQTTYGYSTSYSYNNGYFDVTAYGPGQVSFYSSANSESSTNGDYTTRSSQLFSETVLAGGYYRDSYLSTSGNYLDGNPVPGTATAYSTTSYGYLSSYPG